MRKKQFEKICVDFETSLQSVKDLADRTEVAKRVLSSSADKKWVFAMLAVNSCSHFAVFAEQIIYGCVNRNTSSLSEHFGLKIPAHPTVDLCEALITGGKFFSFRDFDDLLGQARNFIGKENCPFEGVPRADQTKVNELVALRNYVVHPNRIAKNRYKKTVLERQELSSLLQPGAYLLAKKDGKPRLCMYVDSLSAISTRVRDNLSL